MIDASPNPVFEWLGVADKQEPMLCARCGNTPRLKTADWHVGAGEYYWFECRRWLGLRLRQSGRRCAFEREWAHWGKNRAAELWNRAQREGAVAR
jgi:hypothetical protein